MNEIGLFSVPAIYGPARGVSGRTTLVVVVWLASWGVLHARWKSHDIEGGQVIAAALILIGLGILATFPPGWGLF